MIGEVAALSARKNSLNLCNVLMSLVAGILMIVACASYSKNVVTVQNLPFMVVKVDTQGSVQGVKDATNTCYNVGLQAYCKASCDENISVNIVNGKPVATTMPADSPARQCVGVDTKSAQGVIIAPYKTLFIYEDTYAGTKCDALTPGPSYDQTVKYCSLLKKCQYAGVVVMAFAVLGAIGAIFSMLVFAWRMNGDGMCAKLTSVVFSLATFICCTVAFGSFQGCVSDVWTFMKETAGATANVTRFPGVGGIMAVTSFVFFIYVMIMAVIIPGANPDAPNAGLDTKSKV